MEVKTNEWYKELREVSKEISTTLKEVRTVLEKKIEEFRLEAKDAIEKLEIEIKEQGARVEAESKTNAIQDKEIEEIKKDIDGVGKKINKVTAQIEKMSENQLKTKIMWSVFGCIGGAVLAGIIGFGFFLLRS
jgi:hypothetical protein